MHKQGSQICSETLVAHWVLWNSATKRDDQKWLARGSQFTSESGSFVCFIFPDKEPSQPDCVWDMTSLWGICWVFAHLFEALHAALLEPQRTGNKRKMHLSANFRQNFRWGSADGIMATSAAQCMAWHSHWQHSHLHSLSSILAELGQSRVLPPKCHFTVTFVLAATSLHSPPPLTRMPH